MCNDDVIIKSIEKKKTKYKVTTNSGENTFSEETIIKYSIFKDQVFTLIKYNEILEAENINVLLNKALNFLSYQYRSTKEVIKYLQDKKATEKQTVDIVSKLVALGYLNDSIYSKNILDYCIKNHKGPRLLADKLRHKGIEDNIVSETVSNYDYSIEKENALELVGKLITKNTTLPIRKQKMNIYQKLLRDGFNNEVINEVLNQVNFTDDSLNLIAEEIDKLNTKYSSLSDSDRRNKIINRLINKGYTYSQINEYLNK